jgi:hypothetical protein
MEGQTCRMCTSNPNNSVNHSVQKLNSNILLLTIIFLSSMKLMGRGSKLCLVLLQNSPPLPSSEDILAADRAAALCQVCELPPKSLFVLPCRSDHLQGYTLRYHVILNVVVSYIILHYTTKQVGERILRTLSK